MQVGGCVVIKNRTIKIIKYEKLIDTFSSDVSIQDNVGSGLFCLVIENQEAITLTLGKYSSGRQSILSNTIMEFCPLKMII